MLYRDISVESSQGCITVEWCHFYFIFTCQCVIKCVASILKVGEIYFSCCILLPSPNKCRDTHRVSRNGRITKYGDTISRPCWNPKLKWGVQNQPDWFDWHFIVTLFHLYTRLTRSWPHVASVSQVWNIYPPVSGAATVTRRHCRSESN